MSALLNT